MILITHALTGAVIGKNLNNPALIILLSLIFHFLMDTFRHGEYVEVFSKNTSIKNSGWKVGLDLSAGALIIFFVARLSYLDEKTMANIWLGAFFSVLPDFITALYWKFRWRFLQKYYTFHSWLHKYPRLSPEREWSLRNSFNDIWMSIVAIILLLLH